MSTVTASITVHKTEYKVVNRPDGRPDIVRPVDIAVVRRLRNGKTTQVFIVDAGDATLFVARQRALHWTPSAVTVRTKTHEPLGAFEADDEGRYKMLAAVRALRLSIGSVGTDGWGNWWAGKAPLRSQNDADPNPCVW